MVLGRCGCQERLLPSFLHNHNDQLSTLPADFKEGMCLLGCEKGRGEDEVIYGRAGEAGGCPGTYLSELRSLTGQAL
jgi:hypothetical protein